MLEPDDQLDACARAVIDAALEVHRCLGPGFAEAVYERALSIELEMRGIAFEQQFPVPISYKGYTVGESRLDLLVAHRLVVELKAAEQLAPIHTAQLLSYLRATRCPLGLLLNFNVSLLKNGIKRVVLTGS
jgi:GxxExxY protein